MFKASAAVLLLALPAQEKSANPDLLYKKDLGISIQKPPKNEEWAFGQQGIWKDPILSVGHKVDTLRIEVLGQAPPDSAGQNAAYWNVKGSLEGHWTSITGQAAFANAKQTEFKQARLPGGGGGGVQGWYLNSTFDFNGAPTEYAAWCFVGKESKVVYIVTLSGEAGAYKKHQKFIDLMLGSIRCWKRP